MDDFTGADRLFTVTVRLSGSKYQESSIAGIAAIYEDDAISTSWTATLDGWEILWLLAWQPKKPDVSRTLGVPGNAIRIAAVEDKNWLEESYRAFPPLSIAEFFVHASHYDGAIPKKSLPLKIDAATAFGSGEHGTTRACLEMLAALKLSGFRAKTVLDMGTGSGILAIGAYRLWKKPVLAVDNDAESVRVSRRHRTMNAVPAGAGGISFVCGDGYKTRDVKKRAPFDLVIANILAAPLIDMAPQLETVTRKGARVILSGLLKTQEKDVLAAHKAQGFVKRARMIRGEWCALLLEKTA